MVVRSPSDRASQVRVLSGEVWGYCIVFLGLRSTCYTSSETQGLLDDAIFSSERYFRAKVYFKC